MKTNTHTHKYTHTHINDKYNCDHSVNAVMSVMYPQLLNAEGKWSQIGV